MVILGWMTEGRYAEVDSTTGKGYGDRIVRSVLSLVSHIHKEGPGDENELTR